MIRISRQNIGTNFVRAAIVSYLPITKLRDVLPDITALLAAAGLAIIAASGLLLRRKRLRFGSDQKAWLGAALYSAILCLVAMLAKSSQMTTLVGSAIIIVAVVMSGLVLQARGVSREQVVQFTLEALASLLVVSTILFIFGVGSVNIWSQNFSYSSTLMSFGILVDRAAMPLTGGGTSHSMLSAMVLTGYIVRGWRTPFAIIAIGCAVWGLLVGDARAAMFACVVAILFVKIPRGRGLRFAGLIFPFSAIAMRLGLEALSVTGLAGQLSRSGGTGEIATGNSRTLIWERAVEYLWNHPFELVFGNGLFGQTRVGLLNGVRFVRGFGSQLDEVSMHNASVQYLIDGGIIAVVGMSLLIFYALKRLEAQRSSGTMRAAAAMMICMLIAGIFDVWMTTYVDEGFFAFMLLTMAAIVSWPGSDAPKPVSAAIARKALAMQQGQFGTRAGALGPAASFNTANPTQTA